mgnify:FL=1
MEQQTKQEIIDTFGFGNKRERFFLMDGHKFSKPFADGTNQAMREIIADYQVYVDKDRLWEPETTKIVKESVKEGDICVDVGASVGYFTLLFSRQVGKTGKVYSFEPTDNQFVYLNKNVELNGYQDRVKTYNLAAWDKDEDNLVRRDAEKISENPARIQVNAGYNKPIRGIVLDDILPEKVDFIKIDVDGSEPKVLKGLIKTIERNPQLKLVVEYYPECIKKLGNDPKGITDVLDKYFDCEVIKGDYGPEYWNYFCTRKC